MIDEEEMGEALAWERECAVDEVREAKKKIGDAYRCAGKALEAFERGDFYEGNEHLSEAKELLKDINDYLIGVC